MSVRIIIDSTTDVFSGCKPRFTVVPLTVNFGDELHTAPIGSVIGTHAGPGAIAVAFFKKC